jgi:hypothetical protein
MMYRRIAFAAATLSLTVGGMLRVWVFLRLTQTSSGSMASSWASPGSWLVACCSSPHEHPASAGQVTWRRLPPRWPVVVGVVVIALAAGSRRLQQERRRVNGLPLAWWRTPTE